MVGFIASLLIIAIKREACILLSMIMMAMLNPVITLMCGFLAKKLGSFLTRKCPVMYKYKILARLFTYSINYHFAFIAGLTLYLHEMWITLGIAAGYAFSNQSYDQCTCDILTEYGHDCINRETEYSFQNMFLQIPMRTLLLTFLVTSISCHLIQALILHLPAPVPLFQFILGKDDEESKKETGSMDELEILNVQPKSGKTKSKAPRTNMAIGIKLACYIFALAFFVGLFVSPFYGFEKLSGAFQSRSNGKEILVLIVLEDHL